MITSAIVTVAIVEVFQMITLLATMMADVGVVEHGENAEKYLTTKRRVLQFFVPFFWVPPMLRAIIGWWNGLK